MYFNTFKCIWIWTENKTLLPEKLEQYNLQYRDVQNILSYIR